VDGRGDLNVIGPQWLIGDPSNLNPQVPAYWLVKVHSTYQVTKNVEVFAWCATCSTSATIRPERFFETDSFPYLNLTDPRTFLPGMRRLPMSACAASFPRAVRSHETFAPAPAPRT